MAESVLGDADPTAPYIDAYRKGSREGYADGLRDAASRPGIDPGTYFWLGFILACGIIGAFIVFNERKDKRPNVR